jgi:hypothetical protein
MTQTQGEIRELEDRITHAELVTNPEFFDEILDEGFSFMTQDGSVVDKAKVLEAHRPAGARKFKRYTASDVNVRDFGDAAIVTLRVDLATAQVEAALHFMRVWLKREGAWKIVSGAAIQLEHAH